MGGGNLSKQSDIESYHPVTSDLSKNGGQSTISSEVCV